LPAVQVLVVVVQELRDGWPIIYVIQTAQLLRPDRLSISHSLPLYVHMAAYTCAQERRTVATRSESLWSRYFCCPHMVGNPLHEAYLACVLSPLYQTIDCLNRLEPNVIVDLSLCMYVHPMFGQ
jgi:hypothetical protein